MDTQPVLNVDTTATTTNFISPKSAKSRILPVLTATLILVLLSTSVYFYLQMRALRAQLQPQPTPSPTTDVKPSNDPTSDWQTFSGSILSFKYPSDMGVKTETFKDLDNPDKIGERVIVSDTLKVITVSTSFMGGWGGDPCLQIIDKEILGYSSQILYFRKSIAGTEECLSEFTGIVALINNGRSFPYPIFVELKSKIEGGMVNSKLFDQVLSTIKVKSSQSDTTALKTIVELTKPMIWEENSLDKIEDAAGNEIEGPSITTKVPSKESNKLAPLLVSDSVLISKYGWKEDFNGMASGAGEEIFTYLLGDHKIIIRMSQGQYKILESK